MSKTKATTTQSFLILAGNTLVVYERQLGSHCNTFFYSIRKAWYMWPWSYLCHTVLCCLLDTYYGQHRILLLVISLLTTLQTDTDFDFCLAMCLAASPITAEAVAERHSLDVWAAVGMRPTRGIRGAAVKTWHALQESFTPEEREGTS